VRLCLQNRVPALAVALVVAVAAPVAAVAKKKPKPPESGTAAHDGYLAVEDGKGVVQIAARGSVIGRVGQGRILVIDANPYDAVRPRIRGARWHARRSRKMTVYGGRNLRYRLAGGFFRLRLAGLGIDLSAVGRGAVTLKGDVRYADTGVYSLNGGDFTPLPYETTTVQLAAPPPP
jgi:hypothetical protein